MADLGWWVAKPAADTDPPVHWLQPHPSHRRRWGFLTACGISADSLPGYASGRLSGVDRVTCQACRAALAVLALEATPDG